MRDQATLPGMHTFRISSCGRYVFPTALVLDDSGTATEVPARPRSTSRLTMGVPGLDEMLGAGLPSGYSILVAGPSGSGKTILATAFLTDAIIVQHHIEIESRLKRVMAIVKVRGSTHYDELRRFELTDTGVVIGDPGTRIRKNSQRSSSVPSPPCA